jgi:membrane protease YdiL (CAAX protease family)
LPASDSNTHADSHVQPERMAVARFPRLRVFGTILTLIIYQLPLGGYLVRGDSLGAQIGREAVFWALTFILLYYVRFIEHRPLSSVGLIRPTWKTVLFGVAGAFAMVAGMALIYMVIFPALGWSTNESAMVAVKSMPVWFRILLILRGAIFEEIYYRGFMIERLAEITRLRGVAALISLIAFTFAHLSSWGWNHLAVAAFGGAVLTVLYLIRRDLASTMIAHFLTDGVGFLLA